MSKSQHRPFQVWLLALALSAFVAPYRVETVDDGQRWIDGSKVQRTLPRESYKRVSTMYAPLWRPPSADSIAQRMARSREAETGVQVQVDRMEISADGRTYVTTSYSGVEVERVTLDVTRYKWVIAGLTVLALAMAARAKGEHLSSP